MIEIFQASNGQWYFHVRAKNGQIVAASEGYTLRKDAVRGIAGLTRVLRDPDLKVLRLDDNNRHVVVELSGEGNAV